MKPPGQIQPEKAQPPGGLKPTEGNDEPVLETTFPEPVLGELEEIVVVSPSIEPEVAEAKEEKPKKAPRKPRKPRKKAPRKLKPEQVIAAKYSVDVKQIVKWRIEDGLVVVLINYGIKGTKKYKVPLADFPQPLE